MQQLQDRFARRFTYLRLSLTESCNFRCDYCLPDGPDCSSRKYEITLPEVRRLVTAFAKLGTTKIRLTGGEPCLRKDLTEIIATCKSVPGIEKVAMTTNGYRMKRDLPAWRDAGLDAINVSIDSLDPSTFHLVTGQNKLPEIIEGIDQAVDMDFATVKVNTVLLKQYNGGELPEFLKFIKDRNVALRFIELMRTTDNTEYYQRHHVSGESIKQQLQSEGWSLTSRADNAGPAQEFTHPDYKGKMGLIMPYSKDFCDDCNRLRVSSLGQLFLCLFTEQHQDIRKYLQSDDPEPLMNALRDNIMLKEATHGLHEGNSGATRHLAMIGG
ncbi:MULTISPECIES: GTP 3',8-cyclase MoaA [Idiomarina]|jgi:cyclic pyranopterin phosphate synthase|uniref:GTP 3',8-cyclase MoaA n=1 Tax=Idiomarina TaxID=135575 RepID=UPI0006C8720F|nr:MULTISPECIES: GTP 3',8-cyclase MoaA [Idiomarina]KPD21839.1 molybdenum cofactor biosynthesis protein A [Idiomarina abyssalis]MAL83347.1 GTP 3',8-cyclase MoaA [Idiomarina sp.]MAO68895.1 GTP 3',8-cyclase MoaA [Idiomarina sp.]MBF81057.1 GTP 3',8-cyclase MoaA [Idiomarina sp.]MBH93606.1 GTP 3',8-cyclase MoaA [Idiomarina sp.]|tara:strand:- start:119 stop:1096 length:978 start_codon:yes stop_codon:yes gene_type:complete